MHLFSLWTFCFRSTVKSIENSKLSGGSEIYFWAFWGFFFFFCQRLIGLNKKPHQTVKMVVTKIALEKPWDTRIQSHIWEQVMFYSVMNLKISFLSLKLAFLNYPLKKECQCVFKILQGGGLLFRISFLGIKFRTKNETLRIFWGQNWSELKFSLCTVIV